MGVGYFEAMTTPMEVILRDLDYDGLEAQARSLMEARQAAQAKKGK